MLKGVVIGETHIDIVAESLVEHVFDVGSNLPGNFSISVGGNALNITSYLSKLGLDCFLISVLKKKSLFTYLINQAIKDTKIKHYFIYSDNVKDSAFVGIRGARNLLLAVTSSAWDDITEREIQLVIDKVKNKDLDFVVIDSGLHSSHIGKLIDFFSQKSVSIYLYSTSAIKFIKFLTVDKSIQTKVKAIFLDDYQYSSAMGVVGNFKHPDVFYFVRKDSQRVSVYYNSLTWDYYNPYENFPSELNDTNDAFVSGVIYELQQNGFSNIKSAVDKGFLVAKNFADTSLKNNKSFDDLALDFVTDKLTGAYNRNAYEDEKNTILKSNFSYVFVIDIDHFKKLNDTYGHDYGDTILKKVANCIKKCVRKSDRLYRYGGEEFLLFLKEVDKDTAMSIANRIKIEVFNTVGVTVTIGVSDMSVADIDQNVKQADIALYKGKNSGRNQVVFYDKSCQTENTQLQDSKKIKLYASLKK